MSTDLSEKPGCLGAIFKLFAGKSSAAPGADSLPYRQRDDFLSAAEFSFYRVLVQAVGQRAVICPKVRVADVLFVPNRNSNMAHANRIDRKHVDFVLCDPQTMKPMAAVELDDSSHQRSDREERDAFLDRAFEAAGLPLIHVETKRGYSVDAIAALMAPAWNKATPTPPKASVKADAAAPFCSKCSVAMVLKTAKRGDSPGERFWACPNFPKCRETVNDAS